MYISQLKIQGFKSFVKKSTLDFGEGITAVVGPNGCGKTNIVDAIRWVLGEQKSTVLRGGKLEDVIFNGAEGLKPLSMSEVSPSHLVFLPISTNFTSTPGIPLSSPILKHNSFRCTSGVKPRAFTSDLLCRLRALYAQ